MKTFTESVVEEATLQWLESLGFKPASGPSIAPGESMSERNDYGQVVLEDRLRQALYRLNPDLPAEAIEDAFRHVLRIDGPSQEVRNRVFHRMLVDGVTVEYARRDLSLIHISEPTRLLSISYAVFCLKKKKPSNNLRYSNISTTQPGITYNSS